MRWRLAHVSEWTGRGLSLHCLQRLNATIYPHMFLTRAEKARFLHDFAEFRLREKKKTCPANRSMIKSDT